MIVLQWMLLFGYLVVILIIGNEMPDECESADWLSGLPMKLKPLQNQGLFTSADM